MQERAVGWLKKSVVRVCGFSLRQDLETVEVTIYTWLGASGGGDQVCDELVQSLAALVEERPEAAELLRGRTFARGIH